jgi:uncharacterized repeat protein (TIGR03803 family)
MTRLAPRSTLTLGKILRAAAFLLALIFALAAIATQSAEAQTYTVLYNFVSGRSGYPQAGLTIDRAGNLYGTCYDGGSNGTVFELVRSGSGWILRPLYDFTGNGDGAGPYSRVIFGPNGTLYGTTIAGGASTCQEGGYSGCGTVFNLRPPAAACHNVLCGWNETVLYSFAGDSDGAAPFAEVVFDPAGNLYGTTFNGGGWGCGGMGCGTIYKLAPSNGVWTESVLYDFTGGGDGAHPYYGLVLDSAGNLYGTTNATPGPNNFGTVFQLAPSGSGWIETTIRNFRGQSEGVLPFGGLILDQLGNLYGSTNEGGAYGGGTVFQLTPDGSNWQFNILYNFPLFGMPQGSLIMDSSGNLYGIMTESTNGQGSVFKLTPSSGGWTYTSLHDFDGQGGGGFPEGGVVLDANGNLYGRTAYGGAYGYGVVYEITP